MLLLFITGWKKQRKRNKISHCDERNEVAADLSPRADRSAIRTHYRAEMAMTWSSLESRVEAPYSQLLGTVATAAVGSGRAPAVVLLTVSSSGGHIKNSWGRSDGRQRPMPALHGCDGEISVATAAWPSSWLPLAALWCLRPVPCDSEVRMSVSLHGCCFPQPNSH